MKKKSLCMNVIIAILLIVLSVAVVIPISAAKQSDISEPNISTTDNTICPADHSPSETEQTVEEPYSGGWCGNTQASFTLDGNTYEFELGDAITLTSIYINHSFEEKICECDGEIEVCTEMGEYTVNLEKYFIRSDKGQGRLTQGQVDEISAIIERQSRQ